MRFLTAAAAILCVFAMGTVQGAAPRRGAGGVGGAGGGGGRGAGGAGAGGGRRGTAPPAESVKPVEGYQATTSPAFIAPTAATVREANVAVIGRPRMAKGHPCTLWDQEDVARLKDLLKTSKPLQEEFAKLKAEMDKRISEPLGIPEPKKGADGAWMWPGDIDGSGKDYFKASHANAAAISDLGTMYVLSGDAKYGEYAKKMLLAFAHAYPNYGHQGRRGQPWTEQMYRSAMDSRLTGQFLEDGGWLIQAARGYDLVYTLPSWTDAERKAIRDDLFEAIAYEFVADITDPGCYMNSTHNRAAICACGTLMAGYASDDEKLINYGLYGKGGTKEKPTGGVFGAHFSERCIDVDGLWNEGAIGYQFMALGALINDAEMLWRHGVDMYSYRGGAVKGMFDSALQFAYPDLTFPATHDSGHGSFFTEWATDIHHTYEYAWLRYQDPRYLAIVTKTKPHLRLSIHHGPTSVLFDREGLGPVPPVPCQSVNFTGVGYGILRVPSPAGIASLLLEYGPSRSHGHPSKLSIDLFALGDIVVPDPGSVFPYNYPLDGNWYHAAAGHSIVLVDEKEQIFFGNRFKFRGSAEPEAQQLVYGPAGTIGIERAWSNTVYPGVTQDRALFFTPDYLADLFGSFSAESHKYDLAWHVRGEMTCDLKFEPFAFPEPVALGYNALTNLRHATTDKPWSATMKMKGRTVRLLAAAAGGAQTEVIVGDGYTRAERTDEKVPAFYERRTANSTLYGSALDISGAKQGAVTAVAQEGGLEAGFGLLKVQTAKGTDLCFVAYKPGVHKAGGLETDGQQAMVLMDGKDVRAMYLGGGKSLKVEGASIERSEPGLAYVEKLDSGVYVVANPSPTAATITVNLPALAGLSTTISKSSGAISVELKAGAKVEFAPKR
jgi:hypothetical protein